MVYKCIKVECSFGWSGLCERVRTHELVPGSLSGICLRGSRYVVRKHVRKTEVRSVREESLRGDESAVETVVAGCHYRIGLRRLLVVHEPVVVRGAIVASTSCFGIMTTQTCGMLNICFLHM